MKMLKLTFAAVVVAILLPSLAFSSNYREGFYNRQVDAGKTIAQALLIGSHNSYSSSHYGVWSSANKNQTNNIIWQLNHGIRVLELDPKAIGEICSGGFGGVSCSTPKVTVCHNKGPSCPGGTGSWRLRSILQEVQSWLNSHPTQFVLIKLELSLGSNGSYSQMASDINVGLHNKLFKPYGSQHHMGSIPLSSIQGKALLFTTTGTRITELDNHVFVTGVPTENEMKDLGDRPTNHCNSNTSHLYLDDRRTTASTLKGVKILNTPCTTPNKGMILAFDWLDVDKTFSYFPLRLVNVANGTCLDVDGNSLNGGAKLLGWGCKSDYDFAANQHFHLTRISDGKYLFVNRRSRLCMDDPGGSSRKLYQYECWDQASNQKWNIEWLSTSARFKNYNENSCVALADGKAVEQTCSDSSLAQRWKIWEPLY